MFCIGNFSSEFSPLRALSRFAKTKKDKQFYSVVPEL